MSFPLDALSPVVFVFSFSACLLDCLVAVIFCDDGALLMRAIFTFIALRACSSCRELAVRSVAEVVKW